MSQGKFVLSIAAVLLAGFIMAYRDSLPPWARHLMGGAPWAAPAPAAIAAGKPAQPVKSRRIVPASPAPEPTKPAADAKGPSTPPPIPPAPDAIKPGMSRAEVLEKLGQPGFTAVSSNAGVLTEHLIYKSDGAETEVDLQAGKVTSIIVPDAPPGAGTR